MNFADERHLLQLQRDLWQWPRSRAAVMVGAGMSLNAEPLPGCRTTFPTWRGLVRKMFDQLHPVRSVDAAGIDESMEQPSSDSAPLRIASEYEAAFGRRKLETFIQSQIPDSSYQPGSIHQLLLRLPWVDVFTTNYDTLLERTSVDGRSYQVVAKPAELTVAFPPRIVKLHGSFPQQTPFISTEDDYRTYQRSFAAFVNTVQQSLLENAFVLLGFSGDDPNFLAWSGWIRDELGDSHAPIYLVGALNLSEPQRALLQRRGVTPIDLAPLFGGVSTPGGPKRASLKWFLESLWRSRPLLPGAWPWDDATSEFSDLAVPLFVGSARAAVPEILRMPADMALTPASLKLLMGRWQYEREHYPGWLVAPLERRSRIWDATQRWIAPLLNFTDTLPPVEKLLVFGELNWRLEVCMVPLMTDLADHFNASLSACSDINPTTHEFDGLVNDMTEEGRRAWLDLAFAVLRSARETFDGKRWSELMTSLQALTLDSSDRDRNTYEATLWAVWNVNRSQAATLLKDWVPGNTQSTIWKAGLLAELGMLSEARSILSGSLKQIRSALERQGRNIELLSLEGWCTYLLYSIGAAASFAERDNHDPNEFTERWHELRAFGCDPWIFRQDFEEALSRAEPNPDDVERATRRIDLRRPNVASSSQPDFNFVDPFLPAFACIRLFEQVGVPLHIGPLRLVGDSLKNACRWIKPFTSFWGPALLIRAGRGAELTEEDFLGRLTVATMPPDQVRRVNAWCIEIFEREFLGVGSSSGGEQWLGLFGALAETMSRLAIRLTPAELRHTFRAFGGFYERPNAWTFRKFYELREPIFRRLFEAADDEILLEWLPELLKASLSTTFDGQLPEERMIDPITYFPILLSVETLQELWRRMWRRRSARRCSISTEPPATLLRSTVSMQRRKTGTCRNFASCWEIGY